MRRGMHGCPGRSKNVSSVRALIAACRYGVDVISGRAFPAKLPSQNNDNRYGERIQERFAVAVLVSARTSFDERYAPQRNGWTIAARFGEPLRESIEVSRCYEPHFTGKGERGVVDAHHRTLYAVGNFLSRPTHGNEAREENRCRESKLR
jgi:hypothetical protein